MGRTIQTHRFSKTDESRRFFLKFSAAPLRRRETRLENAYELKDNFFVMPSSVGDNAGRGLYSLRTFDANVELPLVYPGVLTDNLSMGRLNDYLVGLTHEPQADAVSFLQSFYGIEIVRSSGRPAKDTDRVNWDILYDYFLAYRFETRYWNKYYVTGEICALETNPRIAGLFVNEPGPHVSFKNCFSLKPQRNIPNVEFDKTTTGKIYSQDSDGG